VEPLDCQECFFSLALSFSVRISLSLVARKSEQEKERKKEREGGEITFSKRETRKRKGRI
jgi:hypothetical protein